MLVTGQMPKILFVGSGLTAAVAASLLKTSTNSHGIELAIWDKSRGTGGRMATSRSPHDENCTVDLGAQYISRTPHYANQHKKYYDELISAAILEPLKISVSGAKHQEGSDHFVPGTGFSSIVKYYLSKADCKPLFDHHVSDIVEQDGKWLVSTLKGTKELFDGVVLTLPVHQVFQLGGCVQQVLDQKPEVKEELKNVQYSSRYALGLFYESGTTLNLPYHAAYLSDDPIFRFVAVDNIKRNRPDVPPSIVLHTSIPFGVEHVEQTVDQVEPVLMEALSRSFPELPPPKSVKCHKWRFSQVSNSYRGQPGVVELCSDPLLLIGGDALTHSNFDGCVSSAEAIADAINMRINQA